jgi:enoyl-CoA hydratase/carnithine racemase
MPFGKSRQTKPTFTRERARAENRAMRFEDTMERTGSRADGRMLQGRIGHIGVMLFNKPEKYNAIDVEMWDGVSRILEDFERDDSIRLVIYAGAGDKAFVSGGDISQFEARRNNAEAAAEFDRITGAGRRKLASFRKPSIAFLQGYCLGGGMAIAMEADLRVASANTKLGVPAARLGLAYGFHQLTRLVHLVGPARAKLILYTARRFSAQEALDMGLVDIVTPAEGAAEQALALAREIAGNAPLSVLASKVAIDQVLLASAERDMDGIAAIGRRCMDSADYREGRTAFMEKRKPVFRGV